MAISQPLVDLSLPLGFPADLVPRDRLIRRLDATDAPVAVLVAPAGHGKTTLVAQWAEDDPRRTRWVCVRDTADLESIAGRLRAPWSLVVDDVDNASGDALEILRGLAERVPPGSRLTLLARGEPPVGLGALRARRRVIELGRADLALTTAEAVALVRLAGVEAPRAVVAGLVRRTEGWPGVLDVAARWASGEPDPVAALAAFSGEDRIAGHLVRDEFLATLAPGEEAFLLRSSVLDRLTGPSCDAVLGRSGSAQVLDDLARRTSLLLPLDRTGRSYRHHRLLADALRARLVVEDPAAAREAHARASRWLASDGDIEAAVVHAAEAGDAGTTGDLLFDNVATYLGAAGGELVDRWLARFSTSDVRASPPLALAAATSAWSHGELDRAEHLAGIAAAAAAGSRPAGRACELVAAAQTVRASAGRSGMAAMAAEAAEAASALPAEHGWLARCHLLEGTALQLLGRPDEARPLLEQASRRAVVGAPDIRPLCLAQLALLADDRGEPEDVAVLARRARALLGDGRPALPAVGALVHAVSAMALADRGLVEEAARDARDANEALGRMPEFAPWYLVETRVALARAELRLTNINAAKALAHEAARSLRAVPDAPLLHARVHDAWARVDAYCAAAVVSPALTIAELRVLRLLPTHLSFGEIAERLFVSANTIKTQAHAVYRKLDATSRSGAVERGRELGLVDG